MLEQQERFKRLCDIRHMMTPLDLFGRPKKSPPGSLREGQSAFQTTWRDPSL